MSPPSPPSDPLERALEILAARDNSTISRLEGRLENIDRTLTVQSGVLAVQAKSLEEHMRRTQNLEDRMKPLEDSAATFNGISKAVLGLGAVAGAIYAVIELITKLGIQAH